MKITWYGTASILIETENQSILFDPYLKCLLKGQEPKEKFEERLKAFKGQKQIFITHGHFDHLGSITEIYKDLDCKIYLTQTPYKRLVKEGMDKDKLQLIKVGDQIALGDSVTIRAIKGKHLKLKKSEMICVTFSKRHLSHPIQKLKLSIDYLKYKEGGEILFYEILAEGKRIQLMGSANLDKEVNYEKGADLLILPHQGRNDIDQINKTFVERLQPKRVLLDHYDDAFPPYSAEIFVDDFCKEMSKTIPTEKLIEGVPIEL